MPIYLADPNRPYEIVKISGTDKVKAHLNNLGFTVGETVMLINQLDENIIVKIKGISLALSKELAKRILV